MNISSTTSKILSTAMGMMALSSVSIDTIRIGKMKAKERVKVGEAQDALRTNIGNSKMDFSSPMYAKMKEKSIVNYPHRLMNYCHATKGFFEGLGEGILNHAAIIGSSIFTLCTKNNVAKKISTCFLAALCGYNIIKNGTGLMEKRDYFDEL